MENIPNYYGIDINVFKNHFYINLEHRKDRNKDVIKELKKLQINANRINAVKHKIGIVGCCLSHMKCVQKAKENNWDYVTIFEDDVIIKSPDSLIKKVKQLINTDFDVMMLGGNNFQPFIEYKDYIKVSKCYGTVAYIVKKHYYDVLLKNFNDGLELLLKTNDRNYSLDVYNHILQRQDKWILITPIHAFQKPDYSDIENEKVNYTELFNANKDMEKHLIYNKL